MSKITYAEYMSMVFNEEVDMDQLMAYSILERGENGFEIKIKPDSNKVEYNPEDIQTSENAMGIFNRIYRMKRHHKFNKRHRAGETLPVLVSEGDSWFQFPRVIREVIDHLEDDYLIWSLGAAGDTAENMIQNSVKPRKTEYMIGLNSMRDRGIDVSGFLFSAAGNDIIGENKDKVAALDEILKPFNPAHTPEQHINSFVLIDRLNDLRQGYMKVISDIRSSPHYFNLPIFIHGYDYVFPYPYDATDERDPWYAKNNEWLGEPLHSKGITDGVFGREIIKILLDRLYDMMFEIAQNSDETGVHVIDCRGAMPNVSDWNDEIHGTTDGFANVAARFKDKLQEKISPMGHI